MALRLSQSCLEFWGSLSALRHLRVLHMPKVTKLAGIDRLLNFEVLCHSTSPSWDAARNDTLVDLLGPMVRPQRLKGVELFVVLPEDKSLSELQRCPALQSARFAH